MFVARDRFYVITIAGSKEANDALKKMEDSGAWKAAFDKNLGPAGITAPAPPPIDK